MPTTYPPTLLTEQDWRARAQAHASRVDPFVAPHLERRARHVTHPVHDFLFTYYSYRPAQLRRWHPGYGVALTAGEHEYADLKGYAGASVDPSYVREQRPLLQALSRLLRATAGRAPQLGCFGLHEWAMVYRLGADDTRHSAWPLRLGTTGTDEVVESHRISCTHFDAYRFFTEPARPRNALSPGRDDRADFEQPGCLHAGMDLYKLSHRLSPMIPSELVADAFELAWEIRILDMRAAPYDFTGLVMDHTGEEWTPVKIETPEGKQEYVAAQKRFAERSQALRSRLVAECDELLAAT